MVLKSAFVAAFCASLLALAGAAAADEYRPDEFLKLDLSKAVLSPKRLGPETQFEPVPIEAKDGAQANADESARPGGLARRMSPSLVLKIPMLKGLVPSRHARWRTSTRAPNWPTVMAVRSMRRPGIRGFRPGRAGPAASAAGSDKAGSLTQGHPSVVKPSDLSQVQRARFVVTRQRWLDGDDMGAR